MRAVRFGLLVWLVSSAASAASALGVGVFGSSPGLDQGFGYRGCPSCVTVYTLSAPASVSGASTITFNNGLVPIELVSLSLVSVNPIFVSGPNSVSFASMSYSANVNATVTPFFGMFLVQQNGAATGTVTGSYTATLGGSGPINASVAVTSLQCLVDGAGNGTCGVTFGPVGFAVNDGAETLTFQHTFNLNIPEPAAWLLFLAGAAGLAWVSRRAGRAS